MIKPYWAYLRLAVTGIRCFGTSLSHQFLGTIFIFLPFQILGNSPKEHFLPIIELLFFFQTLDQKPSVVGLKNPRPCRYAVTTQQVGAIVTQRGSYDHSKARSIETVVRITQEYTIAGYLPLMLVRVLLFLSFCFPLLSFFYLPLSSSFFTSLSHSSFSFVFCCKMGGLFPTS